MSTDNKPKYEIIFSDIKNKINNGDYKAGDKLPSEHELADLYGVSRITSKRALQELEIIGLIERKKGKGSFVNTAMSLKQSTKKILVALPYMADENWGDYLSGIKPITDKYNYEVITENLTDFARHNINEVKELYDGLIYYPDNLNKDVDWLIHLKLCHFPVVLLDQYTSGLPINSIVADNYQGGILATNALVSNGHEKIAFVSAESATKSLSSSVAKRYFGYLKSLNNNNLTTFINVSGADNHVLNSYEDIINGLLTEGYTAVVAENDVVALNLIETADKMGISIPDQLSIVGFDNIPASATSNPPLTTIKQDFYEIGKEAIHSLLTLIRNPLNPEIKSNFISVSLVNRNSIKNMKGK